MIILIILNFRWRLVGKQRLSAWLARENYQRENYQPRGGETVFCCSSRAVQRRFRPLRAAASTASARASAFASNSSASAYSFSRRASAEYPPCFSAFIRQRSLPATVRGPVELSQGFHVRILAACAARASGVHRGMVNTPLAKLVTHGVP